jgi:hypothetical protein
MLVPVLTSIALARLIAGHISLHACMAGMRLAAPLLALREGFSPMAVGVLLALFALTQVFLALPLDGTRTGMASNAPLACVCWRPLWVAGWPLPCLCFQFVFECLDDRGCHGRGFNQPAAPCGSLSSGQCATQNHVQLAVDRPALANFVGPLAAGLLIDHGGFRVAFFGLACLPVMTWLWVRHTRELPPIPPSRVPAHARHLICCVSP